MKRYLIFLLFIPVFNLFAQNAWINEIHYDNNSTDVNEFIEVVIENAGSYSLADFTVSLYNGNGGITYGSKTLDAFTQGSTEGSYTFFHFSYPSNGIQNGAPDGIALDYQGTLIPGQFLSYEGTLTGTAGPANGVESADIGVAESSSTEAGMSLQLGGSGQVYASFGWQSEQAETPGAINTGQSFAGPQPEPSNHVTNFATGTVSNTSIELTWQGSTGTNLPNKYLILTKTAAGEYASVTDGSPVMDDNDWSDNNAAYNVLHSDGDNIVVISGLESNMTFEFIIYPYSNAGDNIDFKTDGTIPTTSATTLSTQNYTIAQIQTTADGQEGDSPLMGQSIGTVGIVTAVTSQGYFLQDAPGAWNGVYVYDTANISKVIPGDEVEIKGTVNEYYGLTQILDVSSLEILSSANPLPALTQLATGSVAHEKYEGVLVSVKNANCTNADLGYGEWEINDGSGTCVVDDIMYAFAPEQGSDYNVSGVAYYSFSIYKIEPRFEADVELVTTAPKVKNLSVSATVPLASEDFTNTVIVTDNGTIASVELRYTVNGGSVNALAMTSAGTDTTFSATIPASTYNDGDVVEYWVVAEDNDAETTENAHQGFFAGSTPITSLHQYNDDKELRYEGYYARTTGTTTIANGVLDVAHMNFYIQDEAFAGINIFRYDYGSTVIAQGNSLTVVGMLVQYNGLTQLTPDNPESDIVDNGAATLPDAIDVNIATLIGGPEELEGILVKIANADTVAGGDPWPESGNNANLIISDDNGVSQLTLRIDKDTNIDEAAAPTWPQTIVGIFTQYDASSPFDEGYQVLPRSDEDMSGTTGIDEDLQTLLPQTLKLYPAFPNPFNPETKIRFFAPADLSAAASMELAIYNSLGQKVRTLINGKVAAGEHTVTWNGRMDNGSQAATGIYFAILNAGTMRLTTKLLLLK